MRWLNLMNVNKLFCKFVQWFLQRLLLVSLKEPYKAFILELIKSLPEIPRRIPKGVYPSIPSSNSHRIFSKESTKNNLRESFRNWRKKKRNWRSTPKDFPEIYLGISFENSLKMRFFQGFLKKKKNAPWISPEISVNRFPGSRVYQKIFERFSLLGIHSGLSENPPGNYKQNSQKSTNIFAKESTRNSLL